jgi:hypothetical protein
VHASLTFWNTDCSPKGTVLAWLALSRYRGDDAVRQGHKEVYKPAHSPELPVPHDQQP